VRIPGDGDTLLTAHCHSAQFGDDGIRIPLALLTQLLAKGGRVIHDDVPARSSTHQ